MTPGDGVAGRFAELELTGYTDPVLIGRGGFAVVYRARRVAFGQDVAIKVLDGSVVPGEVVARFDRERRILGALAQHPNIVTVYDGGIAGDGSPYLVMEYLRGGPLSARVERDGPLDPWRVVDLAVRLCGALETAHRTGVLHRDVKPANILVSRFGEPVLADFGIARMAGAMRTSSGVITATVAHAPPEVLDGRPPTALVDVYSLGSTLFALLTGAPPFQRAGGDGLTPLVARIIRDPVPDLRPRGVPDEVCALLERAMAKDPAERPAGALELGRAFQEVQRGAGRPVSPLILEEVEDDRTAPAVDRTPLAPATSRSVAPADTRPPGRWTPDPVATMIRTRGLWWALAGAVAVLGVLAVTVFAPLLDGDPAPGGIVAAPPTTSAAPAATTAPPTTLPPVVTGPGEPQVSRYGFARSEVSTGGDLSWAIVLQNTDAAARVAATVTARVRFVDDSGVRAEDSRSVHTVRPGAIVAVTGLVPDLERPADGPIRMLVDMQPTSWVAPDAIPLGYLSTTPATLTYAGDGTVTVVCGVNSTYDRPQQANVEILFGDDNGNIVGGHPSPAFEALPAEQIPINQVVATVRAPTEVATWAECYGSLPQPR